jgi:hypothetical protein
MLATGVMNFATGSPANPIFSVTNEKASPMAGRLIYLNTQENYFVSL